MDQIASLVAEVDGNWLSQLGIDSIRYVTSTATSLLGLTRGSGYPWCATKDRVYEPGG